MKKITKTLSKNVGVFLLFFLVIVTLFGIIASDSFQKPEEISLRLLAEQINEEKIKHITVRGTEIEILYKDESKAVAKKEERAEFVPSMKDWGAEESKIHLLDVDYQREQDWSPLLTLLIISLPIIFIFFIFRSVFKQAKGGAMQALDFSKAKARLVGDKDDGKEKISFDDVAGLEESKEELKEIVEFLKDPKRFLKLGARIPKGVLLTGAPGTGKTLLARATAGEASVPFFEISGSEFIELFVGVGSGRVRDLFNNAKSKQPCIIYIDELDAIGRARGAGLGGGHDEREQTLNQILSEMDGFQQDTQIVVLASTNRPDVLDSALLRPGRFDRKIVLDLPDKKTREKMLKIHSKKMPLSSGVDFKEVAERTPGFSGADISNLTNEAAIFAARKRKSKISQSDFLESIEKVLLGPERKNYTISKKEKEITAYHEAGHAVVSSFLPEAEPVRKISIVSRGQVGGYTIKIPSEESRTKRKSEFISEMAVLMGGYCAEKLAFKEISTGAVNDLERASKYARKLVKEFGMSALGPVHYGGEKEHIFLGRDMPSEKNYSEETASKIDKEVSSFIREAEKKADLLLKKQKKSLDTVAKHLMENETIERKEYEKLIKKETK